MRFLLIIAIVFTTGYSVSGLNLASVATKLIRKTNADLNARGIRTATSCSDAYQETLTPQFEECEDYLTPEDDGEYTDDQLDSFCAGHCVRTLGSVYRDIAIYCNEDDLLNISAVFFPLFCTKDEFGDYCINELEKIYFNTLPSYFNECTANSFDGSCTDACKQVAEYIETKMGCCYATFVQIASYIEYPSEYIYPSTLFTKCYGQSVEPACARLTSSVRPTRTASTRPTRTSRIRPTRTRSIRPTSTKFNSGPTPN